MHVKLYYHYSCRKLNLIQALRKSDNDDYLLDGIVQVNNMFLAF